VQQSEWAWGLEQLEQEQGQVRQVQEREGEQQGVATGQLVQAQDAGYRRMLLRKVKRW